MRKFFCTLLVGTGILVTIYFVLPYILIGPRTSLWEYEQSIEPWRESYTAFFPHQVPADATSARYYHKPAFLQGGGRIQLRLVLPAEQVRTIRDEAMRKALGHFRGKRPADDLDELMPRRTRRSHADEPVAKEEYEVYVLSTTRSEDNWNHGYESGIAVSLGRNEVVYWLEDW